MFARIKVLKIELEVKGKDEQHLQPAIRSLADSESLIGNGGMLARDGDVRDCTWVGQDIVEGTSGRDTVYEDMAFQVATIAWRVRSVGGKTLMEHDIWSFSDRSVVHSPP